QAHRGVPGGALELLGRCREGGAPARDGAWFVPAGPVRQAGDEGRPAAAIVDGLAAALALEARIGVAPGKFVARVAAERVMDGAIEIVADAAAYLAPLTVALLPLTPGALDRLKLLGIATIGEFARLPADALPRRFGREAPLAHRIARGGDDTPLVPRRCPETLALRRTFEPPIE